MNDHNSAPLISEKEASECGIITDQQRLLRSRHWASKLKLFSRKAASNVLLGNVRSRFRGRGMEFEEVRRYQAGDDIRTIDWKVTARNPGTYTKLFCEERERPCYVIIDQRSPMFFGSGKRFKSVLAAELGIALAWAAFAVGDRVGSQIIGNSSEVDIRARNSRRAVLALIDSTHSLNTQLLSRQSINAGQTKPFSYYLDQCLRVIRPGSAVFMISDFHDIDAGCIKALCKLSKRADTSLLQVFDPLEESLPNAAVLPISDGIEVTKIRMTKTLKTAYQDSIDKRETLIRQAATQSNSHLIKASTANSAREALKRIYR